MKLIIDIDESLYNRVKEKIVALSDIPVLCKAVDDSTPYNPSGDYISREDLKKALDKKALDLANGGMIFIESINRIIDNAQAIPLPNEQTAWEQGYEAGLAQGKHRPQGEWSEFEGGYRCSNCDDIEVYTPNFCPNCGADMQKGGAE